MGYLPETDLGKSFPPFDTLRTYFGFVPNLFCAQSLLPRVIEAETALGAVVLQHRGRLSQMVRERILLVLAAAYGNVYCLTAHHQMLSLLGMAEEDLDALIRDYRQAGLSVDEIALLDSAVRLAIDEEFSDDTVPEVALLAAWSNFRHTVAAGLGVVPDFTPVAVPVDPVKPIASNAGSRARKIPEAAGDDPLFQPYRERFGFVPHLFRAQALRPDALNALWQALEAMWFPEDVLTRSHKDSILAALGDGGAEDGLPAFAAKLYSRPLAIDAGDIDRLRAGGFSDHQILEAVAFTGLASFLQTLQTGLGTEPDFLRVAKRVHLLRAEARPNQGNPVADPDWEVVARVQGGDVDAFEELVGRHTRRVYRILVGLLGDREEACDAVQETFLKAYRHLDRFQGRAKFSTWLVSIAHNTGIELLRARKPVQSLDDEGVEGEEGLRPKQLRAWEDNPEQQYSKGEIQSLVESTVLKLPARYRTVLMLRDMEHLSTEETAAALGLGIPAVKSRLLRGRLMVREALAPQFGSLAKGGAA